MCGLQCQECGSAVDRCQLARASLKPSAVLELGHALADCSQAVCFHDESFDLRIGFQLGQLLCTRFVISGLSDYEQKPEEKVD